MPATNNARPLTNASWQNEYRSKLCSAETVAGLIKDNDVIAMAGGTCIPEAFGRALSDRATELHNITILQGFALKKYDYMQIQYKENFHIETSFVGPTERAGIQEGIVSYVPIHLQKLGEWLKCKCPDVVAHVVTPPDANGYMNRSSYAGLCHRNAFDSAEKVIVEVNPNAPWLCSEDFQVHVSEVDYIIENPFDMVEIQDISITETEKQIAYYVSEMIPNGTTVQLGLGGLANAVGHFLLDKKDLGMHTEVISNSIMELIKHGVVNGSQKNFMPGKILGCFCVGNKELWEFVDHNEDFLFCEVDYINDPHIVGKNDGLISVNNTLMMDLSGQAASESIGTYQYSGTGGQFNFVQGASFSQGGKSILSLNATYKDKEGKIKSRIVPTLVPGTAVSTPRNDVEYVITEYGIANLKWQNISERARRLINIAHPDFRDELYFHAKEIGCL